MARQNITFTGGTCSGGHGLSIGSVGGRSDNSVSNVLIEHSSVTKSQNGTHYYPPLHHPVSTHWMRQLTNNPSPQASASRQSTMLLAASKVSPIKTSSSPTYRNTASSSNRITRTEALPVFRALAFPSLISRSRVFRVRLLQARRMCISSVGVVQAAVSGRGQG